jgi:hypothetical protein
LRLLALLLLLNGEHMRHAFKALGLLFIIATSAQAKKAKTQQHPPASAAKGTAKTAASVPTSKINRDLLCRSDALEEVVAAIEEKLVNSDHQKDAFVKAFERVGLLQSDGKMKMRRPLRKANIARTEWQHQAEYITLTHKFESGEIAELKFYCSQLKDLCRFESAEFQEIGGKRSKLCKDAAQKSLTLYSTKVDELEKKEEAAAKKASSKKGSKGHLAAFIAFANSSFQPKKEYPKNGWHPDYYKWVFKNIESFPGLLHIRQELMGELCPNYSGFSPNEKKAFWAKMMMAMAWAESTFNRGDTGAAKGGSKATSRGMIQVAFKEAQFYDCNFKTYADTMDPFKNMDCTLKILSKRVSNGRTVIDDEEGGEVGRSYWSIHREHHYTHSLQKKFIPVMKKYVPECETAVPTTGFSPPKHFFILPDTLPGTNIQI